MYSTDLFKHKMCLKNCGVRSDSVQDYYYHVVLRFRLVMNNELQIHKN
jgi:hypothetical protein